MRDIRISDLLHYRGMGEPPHDNCPAGTSLFGNPPTCVSDAIVNQSAANIQATQSGTCPPGYQLVGNPPFCSPLGAGGGSPCDIGNVFLSGSCYPVGSTISNGVVTTPTGQQIDAASGMVIGSYDWIVSHGGSGGGGGGSSGSSGGGTSTASQNFSFTTNGYMVGDSWTIHVTGAKANSPVVISATQNNTSLGHTQIGSTDGNGNFSLSGTFDNTTVGSWSETVSVAGAAIGSMNFVVSPAITQSQSTSKQTGGSSQTNTTNTTTSPGFLDSWGDVTLAGYQIPVMGLVIGGAVLVGLFVMSQQKGGRL